MIIHFFLFASDDSTNRWDDAFYAAGFFIVISGVLAWITGNLIERDEADEEESETEPKHFVFRK